MDCARCAEDLTAYLDGELSAARAEQVQSHLAACASCADEVRSLREAAAFVASHTPDLEVRPGAWNLLRARIAAPSSSPSFFSFLAPGRWRWAMATLAIAAAIALGFMQYHQLQRRNLDDYISQYIRYRQAHEPAQPVFTDFRARFMNGSSGAANPFAKLKATAMGNPFRMEDQ
jgi:Putative zinc-finger